MVLLMQGGRCTEIISAGSNQVHPQGNYAVSSSSREVLDCKSFNNFSSISATRNNVTGHLRLNFQIHGEDNTTSYVHTERDVG